MAETGEQCLAEADAQCGDRVPCVPLRAQSSALSLAWRQAPREPPAQRMCTGRAMTLSPRLLGRRCAPPSHLLQAVSSTWEACRRTPSPTKRLISVGHFFMRDVVVLAQSALVRVGNQVRNKLIESKRRVGSTR